MDVLFFLLLGTGVGIFGTLVGIGGGLVIVPVSIFFLSEGGIYPYFHSAPQIVGTSLFVVLTNALSGSIAYIRQKRVFLDAAIPFAIATLPGAFLGSYIAHGFDTRLLDLCFGCFQLAMACLMYWNTRKKPPADVLVIDKDFRYNRTLGILSSLGVGFFSSILGVGGGIIHVPVMVYLLGFPVHIATATSQFVLACSAAAGVVSHVLLSHVVWIPAICLGIGAMIGAQIGARVSRKTKSKSILTLLALAMFSVGVKLIVTSMGK